MEQYKKEIQILYNKQRNSENNICVYCGAEANCRDHVLPLTYFSSTRKNARVLYENSGWKTLASCYNCNVLAGSSFNTSFLERKNTILERFEKKYLKKINRKRWSSEELEDMGYLLKQQIVASMEYDNFLKLRHENLSKNIPIISNI